MPLLIPPRTGYQDLECNTSAVSTDGTTLTGTTAHTKPTTYTTLIASTAREAYGIFVSIGGMSNTATNTSGLVDIAIGASTAEVILIPDLAAGYSNTQNNGHEVATYYFPLYIPGSTRISGRLQSAIASDTCTVEIRLMTRPRMDMWVGGRVTAYGVVSASSNGTNVTGGNAVYGTAAQLSASTANRIRYAQVGIQGGTDSTLSSYNCRFQILSGSTVLISDVPYMSNATEWFEFASANFVLSQAGFNIPASTQLQVASQVNGSTNTVHDFIIYGVD